MTALKPVDKTLRVDVSGVQAGNTVWDTRFFIHYASNAPSNAELNTFTTQVATFFGQRFGSLASPSTILKQVKATDLTSPTAAIGTATVNSPGTRAGAGLPNSTAMVFSYVIPVRYRGGHPRGYFPLGAAADAVGNDWATAFVSTCQTAIAGFFADVKGAGWATAGGLTHYAVSYYYTPEPKPPQPPYTVPRPVPLPYTVQAYVARTSIGTQRRRIHYNG